MEICKSINPTSLFSAIIIIWEENHPLNEKVFFMFTFTLIMSESPTKMSDSELEFFFKIYKKFAKNGTEKVRFPKRSKVCVF